MSSYCLRSVDANAFQAGEGIGESGKHTTLQQSRCRVANRRYNVKEAVLNLIVECRRRVVSGAVALSNKIDIDWGPKTAPTRTQPSNAVTMV